MKEEDIPTLDGLLYLTCIACQHWANGIGPCTKGFKPKTISIDGGPSAELEYRRACLTRGLRPKHWEKAKDISTEADGYVGSNGPLAFGVGIFRKLGQPNDGQ